MRIRSLSRPLAPVLALLLLCGAGDSREYHVQLSRPQHRGDTYPISVTGQFKQALTVNFPGKPEQKQENAFTVQLEGTIKIAVVDEKGEASRLDCVVSKCLKDGQPLLEPGTVITAENKSGHTEFLANGAPVAVPTAQALQMVLSAHGPGEPNDQMVFGTDQPRKVGDQWPINREQAARGFASGGLPINKDDVTGQTKLVAITKTDQGPAMKIESTVRVDRLAAVLPDGTELQSGNLTGEYGGLFPVDSGKRPIQSTESMDLHMVRKVQSRQNETGTAEMNIHRQTKITYGISAK
ncbi:MAG TPA: hypothetical protein VN541_20940 [Tepidisphaeraceae bacterium]|nr:hypothetical protein [Tepidisphaeraceae bacterium]